MKILKIAAIIRKFLIAKKLEKYQVLQCKGVKIYMRYHKDFSKELIGQPWRLSMSSNKMNALLIRI